MTIGMGTTETETEAGTESPQVADFDGTTGFKSPSAAWSPILFTVTSKKTVLVYLRLGLRLMGKQEGEPHAPRGHIIDLMEALKESMKTVERGKKRAEQRTRRKA